MNETRTRARVVVDTRFADLPNGLFDNCKIAVLMLGRAPTRILLMATVKEDTNAHDPIPSAWHHL